MQRLGFRRSCRLCWPAPGLIKCKGPFPGLLQPHLLPSAPGMPPELPPRAVSAWPPHQTPLAAGARAAEARSLHACAHSLLTARARGGHVRGLHWAGCTAKYLEGQIANSSMTRCKPNSNLQVRGSCQSAGIRYQSSTSSGKLLVPYLCQHPA
jgi:hypothetical protein